MLGSGVIPRGKWLFSTPFLVSFRNLNMVPSIVPILGFF